jgi:hypothetical protein
VAGGVAFGVAVGVAVGVAGGVAVGVAVGVAFGVAFGVAYLVAFLRLPMYLWELPRALQLSGQAVRAPAQAAALWRRQPIHYDEVIQLPLVGLDEHIAAIARSDQRACLEALADVGASLRQQRAAPRALAHILNAELRRCTTTALIGRFHSATSWLPGTLLPPTSQEFLATLNSISDDTAGALGAATRATREQQLRQQAARVHELRLALGRADQAQLRGYAEVLTQWQRVLEQAAAEVVQQRSAAGELPARYVAGGVLSTGDPAFQGRADLFSTLESLLINAPARTTPLLLGQPRTGKSSALCQLPNRLGAQVLSVYLNMEGRMTAATATGLISDLIQEIRAAGQQHPNGYSLPPVNEALLVGDPYRVFLNWLKEVQAALGPERWLLLTLDEFDRIDEAVRERGIDARIFAMLREIIEQHPRVALALSGNYTLAESDPRWREALKSVRTLPVTFLQPDEARRVFTRPAPDFPADVYTEAAIQRVLTLTGRQPFLLHLLGETLVNGYNHSRAAGVNPESWQLPIDIERVEAAAEEVLVSGDTSFASIWHWALRVGHGLEATDTRAAGRLLQALARNQPPDAGEHRSAAQDLLDLFCERDLLALESDGQYHFRIPLFASWINRQRRLPGV